MLCIPFIKIWDPNLGVIVASGSPSDIAHHSPFDSLRQKPILLAPTSTLPIRASNFPDRLHVKLVWLLRVLISPLWIAPFCCLSWERTRWHQFKEALVVYLNEICLGHVLFSFDESDPSSSMGYVCWPSSMFPADKQTGHSIPYRWSPSSSGWSVSSHPQLTQCLFGRLIIWHALVMDASKRIAIIDFISHGSCAFWYRFAENSTMNWHRKLIGCITSCYRRWNAPIGGLCLFWLSGL